MDEDQWKPRNPWEDPQHPAWLALSARLGDRLNLVADRNDMTVSIAPQDGATQLTAPGLFDAQRVSIDLCATRTLPSRPDPDSVDLSMPSDRARHPVLAGVSDHEAAHAAHTRWIVSLPDDVSPAELETAKLLEEPRIEARLIARRPGERDYLRASAAHLIAADVMLDPAHDPDAESAARTAVLLLARVDAGVFDDEEMTSVRDHVEAVLGIELLTALRSVWLDVLQCDDDDAAGMLACTRRWLDLFPAKTNPNSANHPTNGIGGDDSEPRVSRGWACEASCPSGTHGDTEDADGHEPVAAALTEIAHDSAQQLAREAGLIVARPPVDMEARQIATDTWRATTAVFGGTGRARITMQHQKPDAHDRSQARALRDALRRAAHRDVTTSRTPQLAPPGRLRTSRLVQREAQRAARVTVTATPWERKLRRIVERPPLTVGIAVDVSLSMGPFMDAVGRAAWVIAEGVAAVHGRAAAVAWNTDVAALLQPNRRPRLKPVPRIGGGSAGLPEALDALDGALALASGSGARLMVVVTDGDLPNLDQVGRRVDRLRTYGVRPLWVTPESGRPLDGATHVCLKTPETLGRAIGEAAATLLAQT